MYGCIQNKTQYGEKITMHGTISIQELLPYGSVDDVHREVRKIIDYCGENGGLIVCPSNLIQNDTPMENILALYEEINGGPLR
jgi:uroporphyrinogen decarboxylase